MKKIRNITMVAMILFLASCSFSGPVMNNKVLVTTNPVGSKVGVAEETVWLGLFPLHVDLSIATAAKKGKITKIATVDYEVISKIFRRTYRTTVTGTNDEVEEAPKGKKKRKSRSRSKGRR